jgi:uncharacterized protein YndB with AHSA1/START domain
MIGLATLVVILVGAGFALPESAHVERSVVVKASPETVFPLLNSLREFNRWSPWSALDPNAVTTFTGPIAGVGAQMSWSGNAAIGTGNQVIIESVANQRVKTRLQFGGYDHPSTATFTLSPQGEGTKVIWSYDTSMGYDIVSRYFGVMLDRWIGKDYERGLSVLARLAESEGAAGQDATPEAASSN